MTEWFAYHHPRAQSTPRLFCFAHAGSGALAYRGWADWLGDDLEVCPIQLPGRESRLREPLVTEMKSLISALVTALTPYCDRPFGLFGHSLGALIAYECAHALRERGLYARHLLVSARRAPNAAFPPTDTSEAGVVARIQRLSGTAAEVLNHPELWALLLPILRADFLLNDRYVFPLDRPPLDCGVTVLGGAEDTEVPESALSQWQIVSAKPINLEIFPGGHFYLQQRPEKLREWLRAICLREGVTGD